MNLHISKLFEGLKAIARSQRQYNYEYSPQKLYHCTISQLFQEHLHSRFPQISNQQIADDFNDSLSLPGELLGRKSPQIVVSSSRNLCIKMIDSETLQKMQEIFEQILQFKDKNQQSYLINIYRVYKVHSIRQKFMRTDIYILMPSLRAPFDQLISVFDIKGYVDSNRSLSDEEFNIFKFGKDENFVKSKQLNIIKSIPFNLRKNMIDKLQHTTHFLSSKNLIDYSLLICIRRNNEEKGEGTDKYQKMSQIKMQEAFLMDWEIIDYFQQFNNKKKMEMKVKTFFKKEVSSAEPDVYCKRFIEFLRKYILQ